MTTWKIQNQLLADNKQNQLKESHSGAMIKATIAGLHEAYVNKAKTLDYNSFMNAFNDYCKNGIRRPGVGVPIGINLKQYTKQEVRAIEIYNILVDYAANLGGVYSAEHGTGKRKRLDFKKCYGDSAVLMIKNLKYKLDPYFLLNRGNVVPYVIEKN